MKDITTRIAQFIAYTGKSQADFAGSLGVYPQYITKILSGSSLGLQTIAKILAAYPELNARWLIIGEGEMVDVSRIIDNIGGLDKCLPVMTASEMQRFGRYVSGQSRELFSDEEKQSIIERMSKTNKRHDDRR